MPSREQTRRAASATKKSGRTTTKKTRPRVGQERADAEAPQKESVPERRQDDGSFHVDPNRISAKMRDKLSACEFQLAMTEAAFEQSQEENQRLRNEVLALQTRLNELESDEGGEDGFGGE